MQSASENGSHISLPKNETSGGKLSRVVSWRWGVGAAILLVILGWALYGHTLDYPFAYDDQHNVWGNAAIRVRDLSARALWRAVTDSPSRSRPVANLSFALNYYVSGTDVSGYRMVNILIHVANGLLVFLCARLIMGLYSARRPEKGGVGEGGVLRPTIRRRIDVLALVTALLWFAHPVQIQGVTYVVQRMTSLCVLFYLLALAMYLLGRTAAESRRSNIFYSAAVLSWLLALGSKQIAATLPVAILLIELCVFGSSLGELYRRRKKWLLGGLYLSIGVAILCLGTSPIDRLTAGYGYRDFTLLQRQMTQFRVVAFYLTLLLYPHPGRLNLDHHFPVSTSLLSPPSTLFCLLGLVALLVGGLVLARRGKLLLSFGIFWFFVHLAIESSVLPLDMIYEHRLYLPSIGLAIGGVWTVDRCVRTWWKPGLVVALGVAALLGTWTVRRNLAWRSSLSLWQDAARKSPRNLRALINVASIHRKTGRYARALYWYEKGLDIDPGYWAAYLFKGHALRESGRHEQALKTYRTGLELAPLKHVFHTNMAVTLGKMGRLREAESHLRKSLELASDSRKALNALAWLLVMAPDPAIRNGPEALRLAARAFRLPGGRSDPMTLRALAGAYAETGRLEKARAAVTAATVLARSRDDTALVRSLHEVRSRIEAGWRYGRIR